MICKKYDQLSAKERIIFKGELFHAVYHDDELFELATKLIELAKAKGLFENVTFLPEATKEQAY